MWWILPLVMVAVTVLVIGLFVLAQQLTVKRRRSVNWNDLHERGKLIALQLGRMREVAARKEDLEREEEENSVPGPVKKARLPSGAADDRAAGEAA